MKVQFDNVLVCDVVKYTYENKPYYKVLVYQNGELFSLGIKPGDVEACKELIGDFCSFDTEMKTFNGKNKFTVVKN